MNLASASQVKRLLADHGIRPKKRLGQHFLIDRNVLNRIIEASGVGRDTSVLEIGPGLGVVTLELAEIGARVVCVEIDQTLRPILETVLEGQDRAELLLADFLKLDVAELLERWGGGKWTVVGNLPYYITSPIIAKLIEAKEYVRSAILMVQREVADRLQARPDSEDYGSLSVFVQYHCAIETVTRVSRNVFYPVPEVDSTVIRLDVLEKPAVAVADEALFFEIVRAAFGKRRKTLLNALSSSDKLGWDKAKAQASLDAAGIDSTRRGETLSLDEFARLSDGASGIEERG